MAADAEDARIKRLALLAQVEVALAGLGKTFDAQGLGRLRSLVASCPDLGSAGLGEVAASLFLLLDRLIAGGRFDREAIAVHVRAWRLMAGAEVDPRSTAELLAGLKRIRDLYADAEAA